jgi:small subunit ribosomal protein S4
MVAKTDMDKKSKSGGSNTEQPQKRMQKLSEYGKQLQEKQKVKNEYGVREKQFKRFFKIAIKSREGVPGENLLSLLERRLDNTVYRLKMSTTRAQARQIIVHGHVLVNGRKVSSPSFLVSINDEISLSPVALRKEVFVEQVVDKRIKIGIKVPEWLELDKQERTGRVLRFPVRADIQLPIQEHLIVELYSK